MSGRNEVIIIDPSAPQEKLKTKATEPRHRKPPVEFMNPTPPMLPPVLTPDSIDRGMARPGS
jgi:hypothetical protein